MKKIATFIFSVIGGVISVSLFIVGIFMGANAQALQQSFWKGFEIYFWCSLGCLLFTVVMVVVMTGICQIVDNLKEINNRLAQSHQFKLSDATISDISNALQRAIKSKDIDYNNARCSNCYQDIDEKHCNVYDIKPFNGECGYCDSYDPKTLDPTDPKRK